MRFFSWEFLFGLVLWSHYEFDQRQIIFFMLLKVWFLKFIPSWPQLPNNENSEQALTSTDEIVFLKFSIVLQYKQMYW